MKLSTEDLTPHPRYPNAWIELRDHTVEADRHGKRPKIGVQHFGRAGQTIEDYVEEFNKAEDLGALEGEL